MGAEAVLFAVDAAAGEDCSEGDDDEAATELPFVLFEFRTIAGMMIAAAITPTIRNKPASPATTHGQVRRGCGEAKY